MHDLDLSHPAQERLAQDLLGWGEDRPTVPTGFVDELVGRLEGGLAALGDALAQVAEPARRGRLVVTKRVLARLACDGLQADPAPFQHRHATARGELAHHAIARDLDGDRGLTASEVVDAVWQAEASRRPGDPASLSRWLNHLPAAEARALRAEVAVLLDEFREVWPDLPASTVIVQSERPLEVSLAGGLVALRGVPDLVLDSPVHDGRARALVVDVKTGMARPVEDRAELRFYALLATLHDRRPPWRWATYYVPEGRTDREDLDAVALATTADRVLDAVAQLIRIDAGGGGGLTILGGDWCRDCARAETCAASALSRERSHPGGRLAR